MRWKNGVYFQTSGECSGGFCPIRSYVLTSGIGNVRSSGPKPSLTISWHGILNFRLCIYFLSDFCFRSEFCFRDFSSTTFPRARDLVTMAEVGSARLTSLERVTTGVRSVFRGAGAKPNSHDRSLRPTLLDGADSIVFS